MLLAGKKHSDVSRINKFPKKASHIYFLFSAVIHDKHSSYDIKTQNLYTVKVKTVYKFMKKERKERSRSRSIV